MSHIRNKPGGKIQDIVYVTNITDFVHNHACGLAMECEERKIAAVVGALVADAAGAFFGILKISVTHTGTGF